MTRQVPYIAVDFVSKAEANILRVYDDAHPARILSATSKIDGTLTAGVGHTSAALTPTMEVTAGMSRAWLATDLKDMAQRMEREVGAGPVARLSEHQYAALLAFVFNIGELGPSIAKLLKAGKFSEIPAAMSRFTKWRPKKGAPLVVSPGLVNRRAAEVALFNTPDVQAALAIVQAAPVAAPPSSITRLADTPPTPLPPKPLAGPSLTTKIVGATAALGAGAKQALDIVKPHMDLSPVFMNIGVGLTGVIIVTAGAALLISHLQEKARHQ